MPHTALFEGLGLTSFVVYAITECFVFFFFRLLQHIYGQMYLFGINC